MLTVNMLSAQSVTLGNMKPFLGLNFLLVAVHLINGLSLRKEPVAFKPKVLQYANDDCDPSSIPVMDVFDIKKFSGDWYELAKSASGYIDVDDGMWKISSSNVSTQFLFSGRDNNKHCIRPIRGKIFPAKSHPGMLNLKYQTYTTHVDETIRVLFTDYESIAVIYTCMHHVHYEKEVCHAAGLLGAIWTRKPHVDVEVYNRAVKYLEMACVHKSTLTVRNLVGPCVVDDLGFRIDDFPVPDICYQPMDLGSCRGSLQRYYYDPKEKTCKIFMFGGCGGNLNNFMSLRECQERCLSAATKEPVCLSDAKCGIHCSPCCTEDRIGCVECSCEHIIEDDFLNCRKSPSYCEPECQVEEFFPGCYVCKCEEEEERKMDAESFVCFEVKAEGSCSEKIERFYYDAITNQCEKFIYTGCGGNKNNFPTLKSCKETCKVSDSPITEAADTSENDSGTALTFNIWMVVFIFIFQVL